MAIKEVVIQIGEKEIKLSLEEAEKLKKDLDKLFSVEKRTEYVPFAVPTVPHNPFRDRPFWEVKPDWTWRPSYTLTTTTAPIIGMCSEEA